MDTGLDNGPLELFEQSLAGPKFVPRSQSGTVICNAFRNSTSQTFAACGQVAEHKEPQLASKSLPGPKAHRIRLDTAIYLLGLSLW